MGLGGGHKDRAGGRGTGRFWQWIGSKYRVPQRGTVHPFHPSLGLGGDQVQGGPHGSGQGRDEFSNNVLVLVGGMGLHFGRGHREREAEDTGGAEVQYLVCGKVS